MKLGMRFAAVTLYKNFVSDASVLGGLPFYAVLMAYLGIADSALAFRMLMALGILFSIVYSVKFLYFKRRPDVHKNHFPTLLERLENSSFPSVHAARATLLYMAFFFGKDYIMSAVGLLLLASVAASRVALKRHYLSDVGAGILIGVAIGYWAFIG
ncbi:MAG: phosphatase PAP2 family protein [Candidatus Aenigmarchaeota archaeon]|nr:phosphatase PAP2 family protein [Candidatus Aenigmarchaeota archaeon]